MSDHDSTQPSVYTDVQHKSMQQTNLPPIWSEVTEQRLEWLAGPCTRMYHHIINMLYIAKLLPNQAQNAEQMLKCCICFYTHLQAQGLLNISDPGTGRVALRVIGIVCHPAVVQSHAVELNLHCTQRHMLSRFGTGAAVCRFHVLLDLYIICIAHTYMLSRLCKGAAACRCAAAPARLGKTCIDTICSVMQQRSNSRAAQNSMAKQPFRCSN